MIEPVTLEELKQALDVQRDDQEAMLQSMGVAAREWVERHTGLTLVRRPVSQQFARFEGLSTLTAWPIAGDAVPTVRYLVPGSAPASVDGATLFPMLRPCPIYPAAGTAWPRVAAAVIVTVEAGYATAAEVPEPLKAAIKLVAGNLYANRESTIIGASVADTGMAELLCRDYRLPVLA